MLDTALTLMVMAALALAGGAIYLWHRARKQALLMLLMAAVLAANVAIWTLPAPGGDTLAGAASR